MFIARLIPALVTIVFLEIIGAAVMAAENDPLSAVPGSCNAVAVVQMRNLVNSPLGRRGKWLDERMRVRGRVALEPAMGQENVQATTIGPATGGEPPTGGILGKGLRFRECSDGDPAKRWAFAKDARDFESSRTGRQWVELNRLSVKPKIRGEFETTLRLE